MAPRAGGEARAPARWSSHGPQLQAGAPTEDQGALGLECVLLGTRLGPRGETQLNLRTPPEAPTSRVMPPVSPSSVYTPCHRHGRGQVQLRRPRLAGALTAGR